MLLVLVLDDFFFFFNDTATTEIYTLSLHDALPISTRRRAGTGATGLGASPITPTPRCAIGTSAGRAFSAMRSWRDWQGRRCPRISSPGWTSPGRRRSPRLVTVTRWTARSGSI